MSKLWLASVILVLVILLGGLSWAHTQFCWLPSPDDDVEGYRIYECTTSPCTKSGVKIIDVKRGDLIPSMRGDSKVCTAIPVGHKGQATVTAYDAAGNESVEDGTTFFERSFLRTGAALEAR